ncbi:MAG: ParA family protein [Schleiferilactobacillus perolens]|uniref:ParA family protein n=1 Tax=Schleiferilactobacillus perolens TaxID=100468 RepID=UPI0039E7AA6F
MNAKVISFINMKGGVGKTTVAVNLAYELASTRNKKVLLVDMDPQFNATQLCFSRFARIEEYDNVQKQGTTIAGILLSNSDFTSESKVNIRDTIFNLAPNLDLIPGDLRLTNFESSVRGSEKLLDEQLQLVKDKYDLIFIDTPATYSIYSQASLLASGFYIVPMMPDMFAALGYSLLQNKMKRDPIIKNLNLINLGIVVNLWSEKKVGRQRILEDLSAENIFNTKISQYEVNRTGTGRTLMSDRQLNSKDIKDLANELLDKLQKEDSHEQIS